MRLTLLILLLFCRVTTTTAQLTVGTNTPFTSGNGEAATFIISGDILINSGEADFRNCSIRFAGQEQVVQASAPITLQSFVVDGNNGLNVTLKGTWNVTSEIVLLNGIVSPGNDGKLIFNGTIQPEGSANSFVDGTFYSRGSGQRFFPIGTGNKYTPALLQNINDANTTVGMTVYDEAPQFSFSGLITALSQSHYYSLTIEGDISGSSLSLSTNYTNIGSIGSQLVVVQSNAVDGTALSLGGHEERNGFITSTTTPSAEFVALGAIEKIDIMIYDLISPFTKDQKNDKLKIANIQYTSYNKVTLLDRWGMVVKSWENFTNYDDESNPNTDNFDFTKLSPGNYLCIVEYQFAEGEPIQKAAQMITLLKPR